MLTLMRAWYKNSLTVLTSMLLPFSFLFFIIVTIRRFLYQIGVFKTQYFSTPIIVVGNITVGGTGKTPFVIWLAKFLKMHGYRPGIVSRGYGGLKQTKPYWVNVKDSANKVGDEAVLLAHETHCPLVICPDRVAAVRYLLQRTNCNIVISDDGLQHYRLGRDIEIAIIDGIRRYGNGYLLPAGPLRESVKRLNKVDMVVVNGGSADDVFSMSLAPLHLIGIQTQEAQDLSYFKGKKIHAVAGIGHPGRFFKTLEEAGLIVIPHVFPDHHLYQAHELEFNDDLPIIMTQKDAVKCMGFADHRYWFLKITAKMNTKVEELLLEKLATQSMEMNNDTENDFRRNACSMRRDNSYRNARKTQ